MDTLKDKQILEDLVEKGTMPWLLNRGFRRLAAECREGDWMKQLGLAASGERLSVLCIGAHSDDIEIGAGATILGWIEKRRPPGRALGRAQRRTGPRGRRGARVRRVHF